MILLRLTFCLFIAAAFLLVACASPGISAPAPLIFSTPSIELSVDQLRHEYNTNTTSADDVYLGKRFYFARVEVDHVEKDVYPLRAPVEFLLSADVQFIPDFRGMLDEIVIGSIVEVSGEVAGKTSWNYIVVKNCWIKLLSGGSTEIPGY
jgi:hypothetical protein